MSSLDPHDEARRRMLVRALASGCFGASFASTGAHAAGPLGGRPEKLLPGQSVYRVTGKVLVNGQPCAADTRIAASDTIITAAGGELVFAVGDTAMLLRENSRLAMQAGPAGAQRVASVNLQQGKLLSVYGGGARLLSTPAAMIRITGTGVYLEADPELTYFCTCYGISEVQSVADPNARESVTAKHHDKPLYIAAAGKAGAPIRPAPFVNHTDQELMLIETLVGRTPPFVFPGSQYNTPRPSGRYR